MKEETKKKVTAYYTMIICTWYRQFYLPQYRDNLGNVAQNSTKSTTFAKKIDKLVTTCKHHSFLQLMHITSILFQQIFIRVNKSLSLFDILICINLAIAIHNQTQLKI